MHVRSEIFLDNPFKLFFVKRFCPKNISGTKNVSIRSYHLTPESIRSYLTAEKLSAKTFSHAAKFGVGPKVFPRQAVQCV